MIRRPSRWLLLLPPMLFLGCFFLWPVVNIVGEHTTSHLSYDAPLT